MGVLSRSEVLKLLSKLCATLGFCLPPVEEQRLADQPPSDVDAFTNAVFSSEGLNPTTADNHLYRQVRAMVAEAFRASTIAQESDLH